MDKQALGSAIAGGAIATALIETLFDKGTITLDEARTVLDRAMRMVGAYASGNEGAQNALQIIGSLQRGRFTARGATP
jgi:polyhydroxyalkanoate synthesis regulator phasin